jgi:hypothetical protein
MFQNTGGSNSWTGPTTLLPNQKLLNYVCNVPLHKTSFGGLGVDGISTPKLSPNLQREHTQFIHDLLDPTFQNL